MNESTHRPTLDVDRLVEFDAATPRYTSFPTADRFGAQVDADHYRRTLRERVGEGDDPWTLYAHLPFCKSLCLYCGCNVKITRNAPLMQRYMTAVLREVDTVAAALGRTPKVSSIHLGGGTPNYFQIGALAGLLDRFRDRFEVLADAELAIEADPRMATESSVPALAQIGFNRISFGIQDFDPVVQAAIRRVHSYEHALSLRKAAAKCGFKSVNFDLIYGLPHQSLPSFRQTLRMVIEANPDRIALYGFAYVPWIKKHQRALESGLPSAALRWELFEVAYQLLTDAGYVAIGMDHFARPEDLLAKATATRELRRNFQGYTASEQANTLAFGASAIGNAAGTYVQNVRDVSAYVSEVQANGLATVRGRVMTDEDRRNAWVISQLMCFGDVSAADYLSEFGREFSADHATAIAELQNGSLNALLDRADATGVSANALGLRLVRRVAAAFDPYLRESNDPAVGPRFSRTV